MQRCFPPPPPFHLVLVVRFLFPHISQELTITCWFSFSIKCTIKTSVMLGFVQNYPLCAKSRLLLLLLASLCSVFLRDTMESECAILYTDMVLNTSFFFNWIKQRAFFLCILCWRSWFFCCCQKLDSRSQCYYLLFCFIFFNLRLSRPIYHISELNWDCDLS